MSDDVDLYDDLPELNFGESISKIEEERQFFKSQLVEKEADLHKTKERIAHLEKENKILEKNISSLYQTAVSEIKRKDQLIEELRREKESLIFRRKGKQNHIKSTPNALDSNCHPISSLPVKHQLGSVKSTNSKISSPSRKKPLSTSCRDESSPETSSDCKSSIDYFSSSLVSNSVQEENKVSCGRLNDVPSYISQTSNKISEINLSEKSCERNTSEISNTLPDNLFSDSSHTLSNVPHSRSSSNVPDFKEHTRGTALSKNTKQSLSSEERRARQKDYFSDKYHSRNRHRSSYDSHRSSKLSSERRKHDRSWDYSSNGKYCPDTNKEIDFPEQKSRTGTCIESRRKHAPYARRSPSPPQRSKRYSDRRRSNISDSVRVATQLKSKYSKAMRERSVSRTPVKQQKLFQIKTKLESSCKSLKIQSAVFPKVNLEDRFVSEGHKSEGKLSSKEQSNEKCEDRDQHDSVCSNENNSEASDKLCKTEKSKKEVKKKGISEEFNVKTNVTEHNTSSQSNKCSDNVNRSESFQTESEDEITSNKDIASEKLSSQKLRTPPSKTLIPLKISPSFEDPAVVKEKNFSFCVFNEQCEFKRSKRRRSVKVLMSDVKDLKVSESSGKDNSVSNDSCESNIVLKQNIDLCQKGNDAVIEQSASCERKGTVDFKNQVAANQYKGVFCNNPTLEENLQQMSGSEDSVHRSDTETSNSQKLSEVEMLKTKSPNRKRKLDSICEELKANLEKKHVMSQVETASDGSTNILPKSDEQINVSSTSIKEHEQSNSVNKISNCSTSLCDTVNSTEIPERIIISKRRRKVCNLQDNVIQVISQVKSRLS